MSDEKDAMKMTRAEFAKAKREMLTQTLIDEKRAAGERFMDRMQKRHENPPQPVRVKPIEEDKRTAPMGNGLSRLA
jgi:hypothetical protein